MDFRKALKNLDIDLKAIRDENLRATIILLLNAVESFSQENEQLRKENQALKNEINKLKGEQGQPKFSKKKHKGQGDHSSENERKGSRNKSKKKKQKKPKKGEIKVDRVERIEIPETDLPADAEFKGYETTVIQDIKIATDNVCFERATYYSASMNKTYTASLPEGYHGLFGPRIKALILDLYQSGGMTEPALKQFFETHGIYISSGTISHIITDEAVVFHQEKSDIVNAGFEATHYQHLDDTHSPVNGSHQHTHILCNPYYTAYFTLPRRDRLTAIRVLSNDHLEFLIDEDTYALMSDLKLPDKRIKQLRELSITTGLLSEEDMETLLASIFPNPHRHQTNQKIIREAAAIIAYRKHHNKIAILLTDGALQFDKITQHHALCWVHEGRHYKKLNPLLPCHKKILDDFLSAFWDFYRLLLEYKKSPSKEKAEFLAIQFEVLFSQKTGYQDLDDRIAMTLSHKEKLLLVLQFPNIPLHNNPAEGGARIQARKRDISLQTKNEKGTKAKDTMMTITETAKKLGVNTFQYIFDRISKAFQMTSLADLIKDKAKIAIDTS